MSNHWKIGDLLKYESQRHGNHYISFGIITEKGEVYKNEFRVSWFDGGAPTTEFSDQDNCITNMSVSYGM